MKGWAAVVILVGLQAFTAGAEPGTATAPAHGEDEVTRIMPDLLLAALPIGKLALGLDGLISTDGFGFGNPPDLLVGSLLSGPSILVLAGVLLANPQLERFARATAFAADASLFLATVGFTAHYARNDETLAVILLSVPVGVTVLWAGLDLLPFSRERRQAEPHAQIRFGMMAGISHSQHYGPDYRGLLKAEALDTVPFIRPTLGAYVDFPVARWLGVRQESIFFYPGFKAAGRTAPAERYVADVIESLSLRLLVKLSVTTGRGSLAAFAGPALDFPLGDFYHYRESVLAGTQEYSGLFPKAAIASVVGGLGFAFDLHGGSICLDLRGTVGLGDMYGLAPPYETWAAGDPVQDDRYWSVAALVGYERSFPPSRPLPRR